MGGEELERVDLEERRGEEELDGGGPLLGVLPEALPQEVPLLLVLQLVDGGSDLLFRYGTFGSSWQALVRLHKTVYLLRLSVHRRTEKRSLTLSIYLGKKVQKLGFQSNLSI